MFLPFSERAKAWEPLAYELRRLGRACEFDTLDPWALANELGLTVTSNRSVISSLPDGHGLHLLGAGGRMWSGGVFPVPLPDGTLLCILNPLQSKLRHKSTLMEEVSHVHLDHEASRVHYEADGVSFRNYNEAQEEEAFGVGAAALLPFGSFFKAVNSGKSIIQIAAAFKVTKQLVEYRVKITGATNTYQARQRSGKKT